MTKKFARYESYKDSGVEWLGEIPANWEIKRVKSLFRLIVDPAPINNQQILLSLYTDIGVKPRAELEERGNKASTTDGYLQVKKSDIVVNKLLAWMGAVGVSNYDGVTSPAYDIIRPFKQINSVFYHYLFRNQIFVQEMKRYSRGIMDMRLRLYFDKFGEIFLPVPTFQEQVNIVQYIEKVESQIDEAIAQKEKMIELLKEYRQVTINNAVTKGLDPNVTMKDSGIEWLGQIPAHWQIKKLKFTLTEKLQYGANESGVAYSERLPRYIRITDFSNNGKLSDVNKLSLPARIANDYLLKDGDILFARSGATVGKSYQFKKNISNEDSYCFAGYLIKASANEQLILSDFLYLYTNSPLFYLWKDFIFNKATIENIGADKYAQLPVIIPPLEEQTKILEVFKELNDKIEVSIICKQEEIEKLKEYKATLIDSAVTGKIKV